MIDGASRLGALTRVTLPLAALGIVTALIFTFIAAWNEFIVARTLSLRLPINHQPLTVAIKSYVGEYSVDWSHLVRGLSDRNDPCDHPVRGHRGPGGRRRHGGIDQVARCGSWSRR